MASDFDAPDFVNWSHSIDYRPRQVFKPASPGEIAHAISVATTNDRRLKPIGSRWSLSDAAVGNDYLLDTSNLRSVLGMSQGSSVWGYVDNEGTAHPASSPVLSTTVLNPNFVAERRRLVHVQAGIKIHDLYNILDRQPSLPASPARGRWALPTMGGSAGQSLAGAISTSTHGADFEFGPYPETVRAIDIVMADGQRYWIERSGASLQLTQVGGLVTAAFKAALDPMPPIEHYNTADFLAVLVSMGSLGVIYSLVIEVVEQFGLQQQTTWTKWSAVKKLLRDRTLFTQPPPYPGIGGLSAYPSSQVGDDGGIHDTNAQHRAIEIIINPYRTSDNYDLDPDPAADRDVYLVCRAGSDPGAFITLPQSSPPFDQAKLGVVVIPRFKRSDAREVRDDVGWVLAGQRVPSHGFVNSYSVTDTYGYGADGGDGEPTPIFGVEIAVPTRNGAEIDFIDELLKAFDKLVHEDLDNKFAGGFFIRYCQPSIAILSMQNFSVDNLDFNLVCNIEIGTLHGGQWDGFHFNLDYGNDDLVGLKNGNHAESAGNKHLLAYEEVARNFAFAKPIAVKARLHWGLASTSNSHNIQLYDNLAIWTSAHKFFTSGGTNRVFDSSFTTRVGIALRDETPGWDVLTNGILPAAPSSAPGNFPSAATPLPVAKMPPTAFASEAADVEIVVIGNDGQVCWTRVIDPGTGQFAEWSWVRRPEARAGSHQNGAVPVPLHFAGRVAITLDQDDTQPEVFARCAVDNKIYHAWRDLKAGAWVDWRNLNDQFFISSPDVADEENGLRVVVALDTTGKVLWASQKNDLGIIGWNDWWALPSPPPDASFTGDPCIALNGNKQLEVFIKSQDGAIYGVAQLAPNDDHWSPNWQLIAPASLGLVSPPAVGRSTDDGTLQLFAVDLRGNLLHARQSNAGSPTPFSWTGASWTRISGVPIASFDRASVISTGNGIQLAVLAADGSVIHFGQVSRLAVGGFGENHLGGKFSSFPSIVEAPDGRLEVFIKFANDLVQRRSQRKRNTLDAMFIW